MKLKTKLGHRRGHYFSSSGDRPAGCSQPNFPLVVEFVHITQDTKGIEEVKNGQQPYKEHAYAYVSNKTSKLHESSSKNTFGCLNLYLYLETFLI